MSYYFVLLIPHILFSEEERKCEVFIHWSPKSLTQSVLNARFFFDKTEEMTTHIDYSKTELENEQDESGGRR